MFPLIDFEPQHPRLFPH